MRLSNVMLAAVPAFFARATAEQPSFYDQAVKIMKEAPLIDTHIDLPQIIRSLGSRPLDVVQQLATGLPGHVDIPRLRQGHVGGAFWTVWAPCGGLGGEDPGPDFTTPTSAVRDALEMVDLIQNMIRQHPADLQYAHSAADVRAVFKAGRVASLMGMEGAHMLGNSLGAMRIFAQLGVRYVTLTHMCHNAFASAGGGGGTTQLPPVHPGNGLTPLGRALVAELNRLGVLVDLSHTSDETARQAIALSRAPVVWSHSASRAVYNHQRNLPDDILALIGDGLDQNHGVVHSILYPFFLGPDNEDAIANISTVVDHVEHIAAICGKKHVGIGSDFDGMPISVTGVEDISRYPHLIAEFLRRGWNETEVKDLISGNLLRVMDEVDAVKAQSANEMPSTEEYLLRKDLPAAWGGPNDMIYPIDVAVAKKNMVPAHDEL